MSKHRLVFWNVENLFDIQDSPRRSAKLQRVIGNELTGWTRDVLDVKIRQIASVVTRVDDGLGPDLLCLCEVENEHVLELVREALATLGRDYLIAHADTQDRRGIDVAFLYDADRYEIRDGEVFSHFIVRRSATRDLLQVNFRTKPKGRLLVAIGNHWPSRRGGLLESSPYRAMAGETLAYFHDRIREIHGKDVAVIAMGDFNDEPFDRSLTDYALSEMQEQKVRNANTPRLLNLMWPAVGAAIGTHYHENHAHVLDQFLASKGLVTGKSGLRVRSESVQVVRFPEMVADGDYPRPIPFGRGKKINFNGFSDHFPIAATVDEAD
jgi:endonuclease/exonuclease/phosphatase family metal-dependent hydrolase